MEQMSVTDSTTQDLFICGLCKLVFTSIDLFLRHKDSVCINKTGPQYTSLTTVENVDRIPQNQFKQNICENSYVGSLPSVNNLNQNDQECHIYQFRCTECNKVFSKLKALAVHAKTHNDKIYQCNICGRCFGQNAHLQRHELCHKVWPDGLNDTTTKTAENTLGYSCQFCNMTFPIYRQFKIHLKSHSNLKKYKCIQNNCVSLFESQDLLLEHVSIAHESVKYICHICFQELDSLQDIATHQNNHNKNRRYINISSEKFKCPKCDAIFTKKEKLTHHIATENHDKSCVQCGKTFASEKRFHHHLKTHIKTKQYICNICQASFKIKKYLTVHMLKHGDKNFVCKECNTKFKRKDLLQRHMRIHQSNKFMKCPFENSLSCKKLFNRIDKLNIHIKQHTQQLTGEVTVKKRNKVNSKTTTMELLIIPIASKEDIL